MNGGAGVRDRSRRRALRAGLGVVLAGWALAAAGVSQQPLLHRARAGDKPNLVITLDDSRSMSLRYLPDAASPFDDARRWQIGFHPDDGPGAGVRNDRTGPALTWTTRADDRVSARMRSARFNRLYYDPSVRYRPWARADGSEMPPADPGAARLDPLVPATPAAGGAVDLRGAQTGRPTDLWCRTEPAGPLCAAAPGEAFAPATYYTWTGDPADASASFARVRVMDGASFARPASRTDCAPQGEGVLCSQAQEYQNFANWFTYHRTRLYAAIAATSGALAAQEDLFRLGYGRLGLARPQPIDGLASATLARGVRPFSGPERREFFDWLHTLRAGGDTPLRRALDDVGRYYSRADASDAGSPWSDTPWLATPSTHSACRRAYHLLVSDGAWNGAAATTPAARANVDGVDGESIVHADGRTRWRYRARAPWRDDVGDTLADVALYYHARDLHPGAANAWVPRSEGEPFWQSMVNWIVGFGVGGTLDPARDEAALASGLKRWPAPLAGQASAVDDLWHAALNSAGRYLSALDPAGLAAALATLWRDLLPNEISSAGVALSSFSASGASGGSTRATRRYVASYRTESWSGDLVAWPWPAAAQDPPLWRASQQVPAFAQRAIWTWNASTRAPVAFEAGALARADLLRQVAPDADVRLIDYLRGDRTHEGTLWRRRAGVLGDIVHSQPVVVAGGGDQQYNFLPRSMPERASYRAFLREKAARPGLVFFGANDGMLHAVRESDGVEVFAFVPAAVLPGIERLARPAYTHRFFVDGPLALGDAWWDERWRQVLVGSAGAGAASVFALDASRVSSAEPVSVLWEYGAADDPAMGHVLAPADIGITRDARWIAVFGNGQDSAAGEARLMVLDLRTGRRLRSLQAGAAGGNGLGGVRLVRDRDNVVVAAYAGDLKGRLWRFDLQDADPAAWRVGFDGQALYTAVDAQGQPRPITAAPEYVDHPLGGSLVLLGTGKLSDEADVDSRQSQALYGLWDTTPAARASSGPGVAGPIRADAPLAVHGLAALPGAPPPAGARARGYETVRATPIDWRTHRGWRLDLPARLRDLQGASFERGFARFRLLAPAQPDPDGCGQTAPEGLDLQLDPLSGTAPSVALFDTNADGIVDALDVIAAGVRVEGEPAARIEFGPRGNGRIAGSSSGEGVRVDYGAPRVVRSWRQLVNVPR